MSDKLSSSSSAQPVDPADVPHPDHPAAPPHRTQTRSRPSAPEPEVAAPAAAAAPAGAASFGRNAGDLPQPRTRDPKTASAALDNQPAPKRAMRYMNGWAARQRENIRSNKLRTAALFGSIVAANLLYDRFYTYSDLTPSPELDNALLYRMDTPDSSPYVKKAKIWIAKHYTQYLPYQVQYKYASTKDDIDMEAAIAKAEKEERTDHRTTSRVYLDSDVLAERDGYWKMRINERNWSRLSRDMQRQEDEYDYRLDRSRDNDFDRQSAAISRR